MKKIAFFLMVFYPAVALSMQPVVPHQDQLTLLRSSDKELARNKKAAFDFFRIVLRGYRLDEAHKFLTKSYIQHNPNVPTGRDGFVNFFAKLSGGKLRPIPDKLDGLVAIQAENDFVTMAFVKQLQDPNTGKPYTTTWFDMFRFENGKIAEHWDSATR